MAWKSLQEWAQKAWAKRYQQSPIGSTQNVEPIIVLNRDTAGPDEAPLPAQVQKSVMNSEHEDKYGSKLGVSQDRIANPGSIDPHLPKLTVEGAVINDDNPIACYNTLTPAAGNFETQNHLRMDSTSSKSSCSKSCKSFRCNFISFFLFVAFIVSSVIGCSASGKLFLLTVFKTHF